MLEQYADIIRARRIALCMNRRQLAQKANVAELVIRQIEHGSMLPSDAALYRIMGALGLNPTPDDNGATSEPLA